MKKRVLIITYYWPPSGGSGVQRWVKFAKYLSDFGWEPVIFTPENPDFDIQDTSLEKEISADLEVIKLPIWEPYALLDKVRGKKKNHPSRLLEQKKKSPLEIIAIWARANFLIPDPRVFWVKPAVKFLLESIQSGQYQAIITTGPPHSMHLIGESLKAKTGIFWLADFRDPWSGWEFLDTLPMSSAVRKKHSQLEKQVLRNADRVTTISPTFQKDLQAIRQQPVDLLTNGFDESDLPPDFSIKSKNPSQLHLLYTGVIDSIRNPIPILTACKEEFASQNLDLQVTFVGKVSETIQNWVAQDSWLQERVSFAGYVSHAKVFDFYQQADALLLILTDTKNAKGNIPGKLFEYLATGLPILALGDPEGDAAQIIHNAQAGSVVSHTDSDAMRQVLHQLATQPPQKSGNAVSNDYSRKSLTAKLAQLLDENSIS